MSEFTINGQTFSMDMVDNIQHVPEIVDITRGPMDPSGPDEWRKFMPSGLVKTIVTLKDGRVLETYGEITPAKYPAWVLSY